MDIMWQQVTIGLALAAAVAFLVIRFLRRRNRKAGGCANCALMKQSSRLR
ncbi:MAG: FeoB-associated Cys-rich membrane protein [bacterium]|nr:FeoB-associated Cys-rich membrane protein [bacterium]